MMNNFAEKNVKIKRYLIKISGAFNAGRAIALQALSQRNLLHDQQVARRSFLLGLGLLPLCIREVIQNSGRIGFDLSNRPAMFSRKVDSKT